jgi:hypothetical protein
MYKQIPWFLYFIALIASATLSAQPQAPTSLLNDAVFAKQYKVQLSFHVTGATPFTFSIVAGALPACLALSPDEGVLSGVPTNACRGTYAFTVAATDYNGAQTSQRYVLHVSDGQTAVSRMPVSDEPKPVVEPGQMPPVPGPGGPNAEGDQPIAEIVEGKVAQQSPTPGQQGGGTEKPTLPGNGQAGGTTATAQVPKEGAPGNAGTGTEGSKSSAPSPKTPTLSGTPTDNDKSVSGEGQAKDTNYTNVSVFVCVSPQLPAGTPAACNEDGSKLQQSLEPSDEGGSPVKSITSNADGSFTANLVNALKAESYVYVTEVATPGSGAVPLTQVSKALKVNQPFSKTAPLGAAVAGLDVTGAASTNSTAVFLAMGLVDIPLMNRTPGGKSDKDTAKAGDMPSKDIADAKFWLTGDIKLSGMAQPGALSSSQASEAGLAGYLATALTATPDSIVKSIDTSGGFGWSPKFWTWHVPVGTFDVGDYTSAHLTAPETFVSLSLVASGGAITPLSAKQASPPVYYLTSQILQYLQNNPNLQVSQTIPSTCMPASGATPTCYVAFVPSDRSRFYRNYNAGLRLKFYPGDYDDNSYRFPGMVDVMVGQNEYVTRGRLSGWVLHTGGVMPVPKLDGVYIFGSMDVEAAKNGQENAQLVLSTPPSTANVTYTSPSVYDVTVPEPNRDKYSIGFAIDIAHLYTAYKNKLTQAASATKTTQ